MEHGSRIRFGHYAKLEFKNLRSRKANNKGDLRNEINAEQSASTNIDSIRNLENELDKIIKDEEVLWMQKSRI